MASNLSPWRVIASIHEAKGRLVIEGIFVNGFPLENISNGAADSRPPGKEAEQRPDRPHLVDTGMVPPKEE